ncbi:hypothetical protein BHM03_00054514 [Ensete ventricosum]|nr:hypothetical protein BHM03_00054514 [Ensete ventricosum]
MVSRTSKVSRKNMIVINFARSHAWSLVSIGISFRAPSQKFKILFVPDVSWEVVRARFHKKLNGHIFA